jgi:DNA-binding SARP family transcriptional activator
MPHLSLALLGPLHVLLDGAPVTAFESDKVRALLVYLAVEAGRPHRRSALAGLLWPDRPERTALLNLNQALANLRRTLGDRGAQVPLILSTRDAIQLNPAADCTIDASAFLALLAACESHAHRSPQSCAACAQRRAQATALYRGAFLEQFAPRDSALFQEWAVVVRERLYRQMIQALDWLATYDERRGATAGALQAAYRLVELDPWREEAHRQVMRLLWHADQRGQALAQYERCRAALEAELGVEPEEETAALYEQIRSQSADPSALGAGSPTQAAAAQGAQHETHSSTLPMPATPFVGREAELAQLADYLANPACRLITIVGLGGSG